MLRTGTNFKWRPPKTPNSSLEFGVFGGRLESLSPATLDVLSQSATALGSLRDAQGALDAQGVYILFEQKR